MAVTPSVAVSQGPLQFCDLAEILPTLAWQGSKRIELGDELAWVKAKEMWYLDILQEANEKGGRGTGHQNGSVTPSLELRACNPSTMEAEVGRLP